MKEQGLKKENEELRKENLFLKSGGILRKENQLEAYRFSEERHGLLDLR